MIVKLGDYSGDFNYHQITMKLIAIWINVSNKMSVFVPFQLGLHEDFEGKPY